MTEDISSAIKDSLFSTESQAKDGQNSESYYQDDQINEFTSENVDDQRETDDFGDTKGTQSYQVQEPDQQDSYNPAPPTNQNNLSARRSPRNTKPRQAVDDAAVDAVCQQCVSGAQVTETNPNVIAAAVVELENTRNDLMRDGHIRESLDYQKAIDRSKEALTTAQKTKAQNEYIENLQEKKRRNERRTKQLYDEIDRSEKEFDEKAKESMNNLTMKQKKELNDYDDEWQSDKKIREFNRMSAKLRGLRHQQSLLLSAKRFDEADQVCRIADQLERQETEASSKAMLDAFLQGRKKLETKHETDRANLNAALDGKRSEMRAVFFQEKLACENRARVLENEEKLAKDPEHVWIITRKNEEPLTTQYRQASKPTNTMSRSLAPKAYGTLSLPPLQELRKKRPNC